MTRTLTAALALTAALSLPTALRAADDEAMALAQKILDEGAAKFNARDAAAMAATYADNAEVAVITRDSESGSLKFDVRYGKTAIEQLYRDLFKTEEQIQARNTVVHARLLSPDVLVIEGNFQPLAGGQKFPFVQIRHQQNGRWLMDRLDLFAFEVK